MAERTKVITSRYPDWDKFYKSAKNMDEIRKDKTLYTNIVLDYLLPEKKKEKECTCDKDPKKKMRQYH